MDLSILRTLAAAYLFVALGVMPGWGAAPDNGQWQLMLKLDRFELVLGDVPVHLAEFAPMASPLALPTCAQSRPPEALATPDPLLELDDLRVRVSFIVDTAGRVESPFILESAGRMDDQIVLRAVSQWRFRPALCNGVPTEVEARVQFAGQSSPK